MKEDLTLPTRNFFINNPQEPCSWSSSTLFQALHFHCPSQLHPTKKQLLLLMHVTQNQVRICDVIGTNGSVTKLNPQPSKKAATDCSLVIHHSFAVTSFKGHSQSIHDRQPPLQSRLLQNKTLMSCSQQSTSRPSMWHLEQAFLALPL